MKNLAHNVAPNAEILESLKIDGSFIDTRGRRWGYAMQIGRLPSDVSASFASTVFFCVAQTIDGRPVKRPANSQPDLTAGFFTVEEARAAGRARVDYLNDVFRRCSVAARRASA